MSYDKRRSEIEIFMLPYDSKGMCPMGSVEPDLLTVQKVFFYDIFSLDLGPHCGR